MRFRMLGLGALLFGAIVLVSVLSFQGFSRADTTTAAAPVAVDWTTFTPSISGAAGDGMASGVLTSGAQAFGIPTEPRTAPSLPPAPNLSAMSLSLSDFDVVAFKWNTGESAIDTPIGVLASPAPVNEGAVNLMLFNDVIPLYITEGPLDDGTVAFGFVDRTIWTPANGDGKDFTSEFDSVGDRVYVTVDSLGQVSLNSAADFNAGQVIDTATVTLDPNEAFHLVIEPEFDWAFVYYDGEIIAEGNPFIGGSAFLGEATASRANLGNDFLLSVMCICDTGLEMASAVLNNLARDPQLQVHEFPLVLREWEEDPPIRVSRDADIIFSTERADLAVYLTNIGSSMAANVQVELSLPSGVGMTITGSSAQDYGDILPGDSTGRTFSIETTATPVGVYPLTLTVTGGVTQTLETFIVVWDVVETSLDLTAGVYEASASTPFGQHTLSITAPEVLDGNGLPSYFDIQHISQRVVHEVPFLGVHWGDMEMIGPVTTTTPSSNIPEGGSGTVAGKVLKLTPTGPGAGVAGAVVQLIDLDSGAVVSTDTTTTNGAYIVGGPFGAYKLSVLLPVQFQKFSPGASMSGPFELGVPTMTMNDWLVVCPPVASAPAANSSSAASQGKTGTKTPPATTPPAKPPTKKFFTESRTTGIMTGLLLGAADIGIGIATGGWGFLGSFISLGVSVGGSAGANYVADPANADLFHLGEENTPPNDPGELTLEESIDVSVSIDPPLSFTNPSTITTTFVYTRITDKRTYTYAGTETLIFDFFLPLTLSVDQAPGGSEEDVRISVSPSTASGAPLSGQDVLVHAALISGDGNDLIGEALLWDDGQGIDPVAGDGNYVGVIPTSCLTDGMQVAVLASRGGVSADAIPASHGFVTQVVDQSTFCPNGVLSLTGPTPGLAGEDNTFDASGATSGETVHFVGGPPSGSTNIPPCPGKTIDIGSPKLLGTDVADANGNASLTVAVPAGASGVTARFQAVELSSCRVSNLVDHTFP